MILYVEFWVLQPEEGTFHPNTSGHKKSKNICEGLMVGVHIVTLCGVGLLCLAYPLIQQSAYQCNSCDRIEAAGC